MNTHILEQFDVMDNEALSTVEGGGCSWKGAAKATVPGWAAGAGLGAAGYGATCWWWVLWKILFLLVFLLVLFSRFCIGNQLGIKKINFETRKINKLYYIVNRLSDSSSIEWVDLS